MTITLACKYNVMLVFTYILYALSIGTCNASTENILSTGSPDATIKPSLPPLGLIVGICVAVVAIILIIVIVIIIYVIKLKR